MRFATPVLIGLVLLISASARAQNLVSNPDFETGDFTGWTVTGENASVEADSGIGGSFAASFGSLPPDVNVLSQTLTTQIGQQYQLTFFAQTPQFNVPPGFPNSLAVFFGGTLIDGPFTVPDDPEFQRFSYLVTAVATETELRFEVNNEPDFTQLDNISVTLAAPEPGVFPLLLTGLFFGIAARRR